MDQKNPDAQPVAKMKLLSDLGPRNTPLTVGFGILAALAAFSILGEAFYDTTSASPLSVRAASPPSFELPFGSDTQGRDLFGAVILGSLTTLKLGLLVGCLTVVIGTFLGFVSGYAGRAVDAAISGLSDVALAIPPILMLVVIASVTGGGLGIIEMALAISALAWAKPLRQIRSQVLVMRESLFVKTAKLSGYNSLEILFLEMLPNLLPFIAASFVLTASAGILASIGIEALGLGSQDETSLGLIIFWMMYSSAFVRGMWWWAVIPILFLVFIFMGLYLASVGLDKIANPRSA